MSPNTCPFCEQVNPPDAKFCNACGGALHLAPCPRCGAVSDVTATACYQCKTPLRGRKEKGEPAPPAAETRQAHSRPRPAALVAAVALSAVVMLGYYGYRQSSSVHAPQPEAARSAGPAIAAPQEPEEASQPAIHVAATPEETEPRVDAPEESRRPNAAAGLIARPGAAGAGKAPGQAPQRKEVCTQAVEALGLCTMTPEERKLAESVAALKAASARPGTAGPPKAAPQDVPSGEACTEAVAALGLCTPAPTRRGE